MAHHLPLALVSANLVLALMFLIPAPGSHFRLIIATAYAGLIFLGVTLAIGPLNLLLGVRNPVSSDLRRDIGIWAAVLGLWHVFVSLPLPVGNILFLFAQYSGAVGAIAPRLDLFGLANYMGLFATLLLFFLLALSNDWSLGFFGTRRWKSMQRWSYALLVFVVAHGLGYIMLGSHSQLFLTIFAATIIAVVVLQVAGIVSRHRKLKPTEAVRLAATRPQTPTE